MELRLVTENVEKYFGATELKEAVLNALCNLSNCDNDFNGENGKEYLWEKAQGYKSNRDYLLNRVSVIDNIDTMIYKYFDEWIGSDSYYDSYEYEIITDNNDNITAIVLAYTIA